MFIDGKKLDLPASLAKRYASDPLTGGWLWQVANSNVSKFIIGGFQTLRSSRGAPDGC
jgi:hypothetical protein